MYLERTRKRIEARSFPDPGEIHPCTPAEVEALEHKLGQPLPAVLREFLLWCGHGLGELWSGNRCFEYEELIEGAGLEEARKILVQEGHDASLLNHPVLLFQYDECDQFSFVRLDEGEDPPVYGRNEGEPVQRHCDHFSEYVNLIVDQEFGPEGTGQAIEGGWMLSSAPTPGPVPPDLPSILPPELAPDRTWVEEGFGLLPPSVQSRLGTMRASFKPSPANLFAAIIFGVGLILAGLAMMGLCIREVALEQSQLPIFSTEGMSWVMLALIAVVNAAIVLGGAWLIRHALRLDRSRVFLGEDGVCCTREGRHDVIRWAEVRAVEEVVIRDRAPVNTPFTRLIPFGKSRRLVLRSAEGNELSFDPNSVRSFERFEAILRRAASIHHLPWSVSEVGG